jgi:hypothetical protein
LLFGHYFLRSNQPCSGMLTKRLHFPVNTRQPHFDDRLDKSGNNKIISGAKVNNVCRV